MARRTTTTSRAVWRGFDVQQKEAECLQAIEALLAAGQTDVTRNEVDKWWNDRLESIGLPRRTSPSWGPRLPGLLERGILVRTPDRRCSASASTSACQAYTFADHVEQVVTPKPMGRVIDMVCHMTGGSTLCGEPVVVGALDWVYADTW